MRYLGWILALLLAAAGVASYFIFYAPLSRGYAKQEKEIKMWTARVAALEGTSLDGVPPADTFGKDTNTIPAPTTGYGTLVASVPVDDLFSEPKSEELLSKGKAELDKILPVLKASSGDVVIMVHSDNVRVDQSLRELFPSNWELTSRRAGIVARYLLAKGIDSGRLVPCGLSAARPVADNSTAEGQARNRRVEIYLR